MKKQFQRLLSLMLTCALVVVLLPAFTATASAAGQSGVRDRLKILAKKYEPGKYWNHVVTKPEEGGDYLLDHSCDERFAECVSDVPCDHHGDGYSGNYVGLHDCSYFDGGLQCVGFASRLFYELFDGHRRSEMEPRVDAENIKVGDYVRFARSSNDRYGHSVIVLEKNGSLITVAECNASAGKCGISWDQTYDLNKGVPAPEGGFYPFSYYCHADNYDEVNSLAVDFFASIYYPHGNCNLTNQNGNVVLASGNSFSQAAIWRFTWTPAGYKITNLLDSSLCLDACGRGTKLGTNVQVYANNDSPAQRWIIVRDSGGRDGCYNLVASYASNLVIDVNGEATTPGTNVQLWEANSNDAQAFELRLDPALQMALDAVRRVSDKLSK